MTNINLQQSNKLDLGMLVGMLLTDGSVNVSGSHRNIAFTSRSEVLHTLFKSKMRKLFGITEFQEWKDKRWRNVKTTFIRSAEIFNQLQKIVPSYSTKPNIDGTFPPSKIPEFIFRLNLEEITKVLQVMFSTDGCVCLGVTWSKSDKMWQIRRLVKFACIHPVIKKQISMLLNLFDINNKVDDEGVVIWREQDIRKFQKKIGFVKGVEVTRNSRNWEGFEKNEILNLVIRSFEFKKKDLQKFGSKEDVIGFLKSLV